MPRRHSLAGKIVLWGFGLIVCTATLAVGLYAVTGAWWFAFIGTTAAMAVVAAASGEWLLAGTQRLLRALADGMQSLQDHDFSISISHPGRGRWGHDGFTEAVAGYNRLSAALRIERQDLYQRELLLDSVIQATPLALILTNAAGTVLYSNVTARRLLNTGRKLEGTQFDDLLKTAPAALSTALGSKSDSLFTMQVAGEAEVFHLAQRDFVLNAELHRLYLLKQLTREINAQEVAAWKKAIRVMAHELNNSLAPISSLVHSGRLIVAHSAAQQIERVFDTIEERVRHLRGFIDGYAQFSKLPKPRAIAVLWPEFLDSLRSAAPFVIERVPDAAGTFDPAQLGQVMINLLKNATESGSSPDQVVVAITTNERSTQIEVRDRGSGMSDSVLENALLPFYSTKPAGTGLGLALCREIVEAHGGRITLANRTDGGLVVTLLLPAGDAD